MTSLSLVPEIKVKRHIQQPCKKILLDTSLNK